MVRVLILLQQRLAGELQSERGRECRTPSLQGGDTRGLGGGQDRPHLPVHHLRIHLCLRHLSRSVSLTVVNF